MKKCFTCCLLSFCSWPLPTWSQQERIWVFGTQAGLDFNGTTTAINSGIPDPFWKSCANVCDNNGELLFVTDGSRIWDRNKNPMPHGDTLLPVPYWMLGAEPMSPTKNTSQGTIIVPMPDSASKYYVFSLTSEEPVSQSGQLYYSVVDMTLNGGLGDVDTNRRGILLDSLLTERMTAIATDCENNSIWLLVVPRIGFRRFKAFKIGSSGINLSPVVSDFPSLPNYHRTPGKIIASHDGKKIGLCSAPHGNVINLSPSSTLITNSELFDFDITSGQVSNAIVLDTSTAFSYPLSLQNSLCFSPDNSKLYTNRGSKLRQYDLSLGTPAAIVNSKTVLNTTFSVFDMKVGPDKKLYLMQRQGFLPAKMGIIHAPNLGGVLCQYDSVGIDLLSGTDRVVNLPSTVPFIQVDTYSTRMDTTICFPHSLILQPTMSSPIHVVWDNGSSEPSRTVGSSGTYWVSYRAGCAYIDTFIIRVNNELEALELGPDTVLCNTNGSYLLKGGISNAEYLWQDGSTDNSFTVTQNGTYWVQATKEGCTSTDTVHVSYKDLRQQLGQDISLCRDEAIYIPLTARVPAGATVLWNTGATASQIIAQDTGVYWAIVQEPPCMGSDSIHIDSDQLCRCRFLVPNAFSPNNDGVNDDFGPIIETACPVTEYRLSIYNRFGQRIFTAVKVADRWNGYSEGRPADTGTYFYEISFKEGTRQNDFYQKGDLTLLR